jgi:general L-amino acid transport system substrate-binding protein
VRERKSACGATAGDLVVNIASVQKADGKAAGLRWTAAGVLAATLGWAVPAHAGKTLDAVRARGQVVCGVNTGLPGFSAADDSGRWAGLDVDICRAVAAAVLGDGQKVTYVPLGPHQRFTALQSGEIDVLSRNTTFSLMRDASMGLHQTAVTYYDGQGFLVPAKSRIKSVKQLKGQTVCMQSGTTTEKNLVDYSRAHQLDLKPVVFERVDAATRAYFAGRCAAYSTDASGLASARSAEPAKVASAHVILPDLISKEPLGPMVRRGDDEWFAIVRWVIHGLVEAEEYGVAQDNLDQLKSSANPAVQRILGTAQDTGSLLGLDREWLARAIRTTGNYGEIYERNVGSKSPLGIPRGLNHQWYKGGLMYAFPVR